MHASYLNLTLGSLLTVVVLHAAASESKLLPQKVLTPEEAAQQAYAKAVSNPDKAARTAGIAAFAAAKPVLPQSWQMFYQTAVGDPDSMVRFDAYKALATMPAHDNTVVKMMIAVFNSLKLNDWKDRALYAKVMNTSEFKAELGATLADQISRMRYPEDQKGYGKLSDKAKEELKQKRQELMDMLDAFNDIAKSSITTSDKEMPAKVKKWWESNSLKFEKADAEIMAKYAKADAEAAQQAKLAREKEKKEKEAAK